jgi:uncharacterized protein (DUF305 family)
MSAIEDRAGLSWLQAIVLAAATCFLGFAVAQFLERDEPPATGSVEVGFAQDMITHHEQAVEMASLVINNGESPVVRAFAKEIMKFQAYEIGLMDGWLMDWGYSRATRSDEAMAWMEEPVPVRSMPGLATDAQMDHLGDARGAAADGLFLELMAVHHRGGIPMAEHAAEHSDEARVRELAQRIARNQAVEINEYAQTAERLGLDADIERYETDETETDHDGAHG